MPIPVLTISKMRQWENATWATGRTEAAVIEQVGRVVATVAKKMCPEGGTVLILAGKGHNGDDARQAQPHLSGRNVSVIDILDPVEAIGKLKAAAAGSTHAPDLLIDALFGIGLNRPLSLEWKKLIETINQLNLPILSVDVPSGLNADTGETFGIAVRATTTLTVGAPKRGLILHAAAEFVGRLEVASDVGLIPCPFKGELKWVDAGDFLHFPPRRSIASHKGTYGHLAIVAGSLGYHGAAVLTTRGALCAQPGLVTLYTPENIYLPIASQLQAAMVHPWTDNMDLPKNCTAILFGPGLASATLPKEMKDQLRTLWNTSPLPLIVDASALEWLEPGAISSPALRIITPHPGEASKLLNVSVQKVQSDRFAAVRELSTRFSNCWVVLKGHQALIGRATGPIFVNSSGNPFLAQGGSGDILAGYLGGLLAQPLLQANPAQTLSYAVWEHGASADYLSESKSNWTIEELLPQLGLKKKMKEALLKN